MDNYTIFKKFHDSRTDEETSKSIWFCRRACFWFAYRDEFEQAQKRVKRSVADTTRFSKEEWERLEGSGIPAPISANKDFSEYSLRRGGVRRREVDLFRDLISGEMVRTDWDWEDAEKDEKVQSRVFADLDKGILVLGNIPRIPKEYDNPKFNQRYFGFDSEDNGLGIPHYYQFAWESGVAISHSFRLLARWAVQEFNLQEGNHVIWCTNLEYDYGNIVKDWESHKGAITINYRKGRLPKVVINYNPNKAFYGNPDTDQAGKMVFWDTLNHWPLGVKGQGEALSDLLGFNFSKFLFTEICFHGCHYFKVLCFHSKSCLQQKGYSFTINPRCFSFKMVYDGIR
jgi:hypothetical protein